MNQIADGERIISMSVHSVKHLHVNLFEVGFSGDIIVKCLCKKYNVSVIKWFELHMILFDIRNFVIQEIS